MAAKPATGHARDWEALVDETISWTRLGDLTIMAFGDDVRPQVWTSQDDIHWTAARLPGPHGDVAGMAVSRGGQGLVAYASFEEGGWQEWTSPDGTTWSIGADASLTDGQQWLLAATADGATWSGATDVTSFSGPAFPETGDVRIAAAGSTLLGFVRSAKPLEVWRSVDGSAWTKTSVLKRGSRVKFAVGGPRGWFAFGCRHGCLIPAGWTSADGTTWRAARTVPSGRISALVALPEGFVALGSHDTGSGCVTSQESAHGVTWTSVDGSRWWRTRLMQAGSVVAGIIPGESGLVGVGVGLRGDSTTPTSWSGRVKPTGASAPRSTPTPNPSPC